jgi:hypothetical protein
VHDVGFRHERHTIPLERRENGADLGNLKVDGRATLRRLPVRRDTDDEAHTSAIEECHLRRSREQKGKAKNVSIKRHALV